MNTSTEILIWKLLGCQGDWSRVEYQGVKGWLAKEDQCGAALTSCS